VVFVPRSEAVRATLAHLMTLVPAA